MKVFFAKPGEYQACGLVTVGHLVIFVLTAIGVIVAVKCTKIRCKEDVTTIIRRSTIIIWILEILKTIYSISIGDGTDLNKIAPLYYCSLLLYSGLLSSFCKGKLNEIGDVFLATGGIVGGIVFWVFPTTSLPYYPVFHFVSVHSYFYHGMMVYLGIIINKYNYIELKLSHIKQYAILIFTISVIAYIINLRFGSNLMFISEDFPGTPISIVYNHTGKLFTPLMIAIQMTLPFLLIYGITKLKKDVT